MHAQVWGAGGPSGAAGLALRTRRLGHQIRNGVNRMGGALLHAVRGGFVPGQVSDSTPAQLRLCPGYLTLWWEVYHHSA